MHWREFARSALIPAGPLDQGGAGATRCPVGRRTFRRKRTSPFTMPRSTALQMSYTLSSATFAQTTRGDELERWRPACGCCRAHPPRETSLVSCLAATSTLWARPWASKCVNGSSRRGSC